MNQFYPNLFSPITIRGKTFKNRILLGPKGYPTRNHDPLRMNEDQIDFYERIAKGGAARIVASECDVQYGSAVFSALQMFLDPLPDSLRESLGRYAEVCHKHGALAFQHFGHTGVYARDEEYRDRMRAEGKMPSWRPPTMPAPLHPDGTPYVPIIPMGPSELVIDEPWDGITQSLVYDMNDGKHVAEMTRRDMEELADAFAVVARNAKLCGMDGMSIHSGHGFIFSQWISERFNHRTDEFGGSMENRARFPIMCLQRIREAVGEDFIVEMRFSAEENIDMVNDRDYLEGLVTVDQAEAFFRELDKHPGLVDIAHISGGLHFVPYYNTRTIPNSFFPMGLNLEAAARIKAAVTNIKVACVGALADPALCEKAIAEGKVDFVVLTRQLCYADPEFPNKAERGEPEQINNCLRCVICNRSGHCAVNPMDVNSEIYDRGIPRSARPKHIAVIGGGIAGMKAAEYAVLAGHHVTLFEQSDRLGGILLYTENDRFKPDIYRFVTAMAKRLETMAVDIRLNCRADGNTVRALGADVVIVATGALFRAPDFPAEEGAAVRNSLDCYMHLDEIGQRAVILGGGLTACEAAIHLADSGRSVCVVSRSDKLMNRVQMIGPAYGSTDAQLLRMDKLGVQKQLGCRCVGVSAHGAEIENKEGEHFLLEADTVINAIGETADPDCIREFDGSAEQVLSVGDCAEPANIGDAVLAAYEAIITLQ